MPCLLHQELSVLLFLSTFGCKSWEGHECKLGNVAADPGGNCQVRSSRSTGSQIHTPNTVHSPYIPLQIIHFSSSQIHIWLQCTRPVNPSKCTALTHKYISSFSVFILLMNNLLLRTNTHPSTLYCTNISIHNRQQLTHPSSYKALTPNKPLNTLYCTEHTQTSFHASEFQQYCLANAIECPQMQPMLY